MKQLNILLAAVFLCISASAQTDTTTGTKKSDTLRIGNIIIIKKGKGSGDDKKTSIEMDRKEFNRKHSRRITTNWWQVDVGFSNYDDKTNYVAANANADNQFYLVNKPGSDAFSKSDFKLRTGKSINVNIWLFMQKINLIKKNVNLKYGLGVELNNYRYKTSSLLSYKEDGIRPYNTPGPSNSAFIFRDSVSHFSKNKLAADYITVPVMLNFSTTPRYNKPTFGFSAGVSFGYLYSQRNKQKSEERGKFKNKADYDLEKFKLSYVAELALGPIKLYGSYSPKSMYEHTLDMRPYNFGIRFSNW